MSCLNQPTMATDTWTEMNEGTRRNGAWDCNGTMKQICLDHSGPGAYVLYPLAQLDPPPTGIDPCPMSDNDWSTIAGGTLDTETNTVAKNGHDYCVAHNGENNTTFVIDLD